jgi:hypothetical protein
MKVKKPAKLTITVEASSPATIEKMLEQALFELRQNTLDDNGYQKSFSNAAQGDQSGTMGSYSFEYVKAEYEEGSSDF